MNSKMVKVSVMFVYGLFGTIAIGDDLLPKTPSDWKYERIDFPLSFAPDINYKGFEELRFAPGMFDANSETYFTYIFALQLNGQHKVDVVLLKDLLTKYYRGLCRAVWADEIPKPDFSSIAVDITTEASSKEFTNFRAVVQMIDAFVTRKPVQLHLDIQTRVDTANQRTLIYAQVSPKPRKHNVWKLLRSVSVNATESRH